MNDYSQLTPDEVTKLLLKVESHNRTARLNEIIGDLKYAAYQRAILDTWSSTQAPSEDFDFWSSWLPCSIITDDPRAWRSLPNELTIYRGAGSERTARNGFSWTLDHNIALEFAQMTTLPIGSRLIPRPDGGYLATGTVHKLEVSMYLTDREESEIVLNVDFWPSDHATFTRVPPCT